MNYPHTYLQLLHFYNNYYVPRKIYCILYKWNTTQTHIYFCSVLFAVNYFILLVFILRRVITSVFFLSRLLWKQYFFQCINYSWKAELLLKIRKRRHLRKGRSSLTRSIKKLYANEIDHNFVLVGNRINKVIYFLTGKTPSYSLQLKENNKKVRRQRYRVNRYNC